ncbi:hypothetical protein SAMN05216474_2516 [Lishizhenia tianjinensis]|uniref:Uncharacterized protein n=1 Tax=Lishizhenia tianjinensis TaxID=477690 RepID=A0A1I7B3H7_9FLAO|nr:hypothetical protein [Lishizhenia tianjinensis]SFT81737.1 hypothetical protein SAMN05216474_2516 [Lishizhenia tianjinensis]
MKEELKGPKVEGISVAVAFETAETGDRIYNVYLLNKTADTLENVLVSSKGYGVNAMTEEKIETSVLRHSLGDVAPQKAQKIEPIMEQVFGLSNEYWISYWIGNKMYDKKFVFLAETITEQNAIDLPLLECTGVMLGE